ncbi:hypothetical protein BH23CHL2_BH23CHL2_32050 [soil metagenome]
MKDQTRAERGNPHVLMLLAPVVWEKIRAKQDSITTVEHRRPIRVGSFSSAKPPPQDDVDERSSFPEKFAGWRCALSSGPDVDVLADGGLDGLHDLGVRRDELFDSLHVTERADVITTARSEDEPLWIHYRPVAAMLDLCRLARIIHR